VATVYDSELTLREARARYFELNGIPRDGGYSRRWVKVTRNRLPLYIPNSAPRKKAVPYHDLHHVLTEYDTSNVGEAEISAWEVAAGTWPHGFAFFLGLAGLSTGLLISPRRTFRAFVRGRHSRTLYSEPCTDELLSARVGEARERLGIGPRPADASWSDALAFAGASALGVLTLVLSVVFAPVLIVIGLLWQ
jgi:hypothetical protein